MTDGWLTMRQALSVLITGLVAVGLGLSQPGYAAPTEGQEFLEGLRGLKVPDMPAPESHRAPAPGKARPASGGHSGGTRPHPETPKSVVPAAQAAGSAPAGDGVRVPGAGTTPPDADVQRLKAALAQALAQRREQEKAAAAGQAQADGQVSDLKASLERAMKERDEARRQAAMQAARGGQAVKEGEKAQADMAAREAAVSTLNAQVTGLQAALAQAEKVQGDIRRDMTAQLAGAADKLKDVTQARDAAQADLGVARAKEDQLRAELVSRDASLKKAELSARSLADVQQTLDSKTRELAALNDKAQALTRERDALKKTVEQTAPAQAVRAEVSPPRYVPDSPAGQDAYASGWQAAAMVRRALDVQKALGVGREPRAFLAGLTDGVGNTPAMDEPVLAERVRGLTEDLSKRERARFDAGMQKLETLTHAPDVLKRNGTVLFVRKAPGKREVRDGMVLAGSLREAVLDGRVLTDRQDITFDYGPQLPAMVRDAIAIGRVGATVEVVCFAADIYPVTAMPEGVYPWTLLKYTVSTTREVPQPGRGGGAAPAGKKTDIRPGVRAG